MSELQPTEWILLVLFSLNGTILLFFALIEVADWLSTTRWFKKHFTKYGG